MIPIRWYKPFTFISPFAIIVLSMIVTELLHNIDDDTNEIFAIIAVIISIILLLGVTALSAFLNESMYEKFKRMLEQHAHNMINVEPNDLKKLARACIRLDKYNLSYSINYYDICIDVEVSIGLYTRMSIAKNIDPIVKYHITGTDVILHNAKDTDIDELTHKY